MVRVTYEKLRRTSLFHDNSAVGSKFLVELHGCFTESLYEPREEVPWNNTMRSLGKGVITLPGRFRCPPGIVWGEDFVFESFRFKDRRSAVALSFVTVLSLTRGQFADLLSQYPKVQKHVRKVTLRMLFRRAVLDKVHVMSQIRRFGMVVSNDSLSFGEEDEAGALAFENFASVVTKSVPKSSREDLKDQARHAP